MELIVLTLLILLNGFFALSEIALVSSKRTRLERLKAEGSKGAGIALKLLDDSGAFLSAIQVGITLIGIITGVYGGISISDDIAPWFENIEFTRPFAGEIALTVTVLVITYFSIVIGELVPKTIALSNPERISVRIAPAIHYFTSLFYPVVKLLSSSTRVINSFIGIGEQSGQMTESELRQIIKTASIEGVIEKEQTSLHEKIFYFSDKRAKHLMTYRTEIEWIDISKPVEVLLHELEGMKHSRIVCCKRTLDNIQGIILQRDFFKRMRSGNSFRIDDILIRPVIMPENADSQRVLLKLRKNQSNFCFVVNEYGGFEGIITLHDIMESLVGQIAQEGEPMEPDVHRRTDDSFLVSGDAPAEVLAEIFDNFTIDYSQTEYTSIAGFVLDQINKIPQVGDEFEYAGHRIEIVDIDGNRIDKVLITKIQS